MKCSNCNSTSIMESNHESKIIKGVKYALCNHCKNVMIKTSAGKLVPTPQNEAELTKVLIEDAAFSFRGQGLLAGVSLTGLHREPTMQAIAIAENMQEYLNQFENDCDCCNEDDCSPCCDLDCDCCDEGCSDFEEQKNIALANNKPILREDITVEASIENGKETQVVVTDLNSCSKGDKKDYLVIDGDAKQHLFKSCSKEFLLNIINDMKPSITLYELNEIKPKVKYEF